jgi:hypothetical protein
VVTAIELVFEPEKETKGTWRFQEFVASEFDEAKVGTIYVRKSTLGQLGYQAGQRLELTLDVKTE